MLTSTISQTKNHLSALLAKVQNGETLIILDRKKPVARVVGVVQTPMSPHLQPPVSTTNASDVLKLPIGGQKGKSSGVLAALLDEREKGL